MIRYIPYCEMKSNQLAYDIMILRDQFRIPYTTIAKDYDITTDSAMQTYYKMKSKQIRLYINQIAFMLDHKDTSKIKKIFKDAQDCYKSNIYVCAYMEKKYADILTDYRMGEPGMPEEFLNSVPAPRAKVSKDVIKRIIKLRDEESASFKDIAEELSLSRSQAKNTYDFYYHHKTLEIINKLESNAKDETEIKYIWKYCFNNNLSAKNRYEMMLKFSILSSAFPSAKSESK